MGKKDKHKPGQSRNNPIFKVVGGKAGKAKNKPREVNIKLKNQRMGGSKNVSVPKYKKNEKVYAFDGPWIYPATILRNYSAKDTIMKMHRIHYNDWPKVFDEDVTSERLLKINNETRKIHSKLEAQSEEILHGTCTQAKRILKIEGKIQKFEIGESVIVFSEWLLHPGDVIGVNYSKANLQYCVRYKFTKIHYEEGPISGDYIISKDDREEWLNSDKLFKNTYTSIQIAKNLIKYRKIEDKNDMKYQLENSNRKNELDKQQFDQYSRQNVDITIDKEADSTMMSISQISGSSDIYKENSINSLKGRAPQKNSFLRYLNHNSTFV